MVQMAQIYIGYGPRFDPKLKGFMPFKPKNVTQTCHIQVIVNYKREGSFPHQSTLEVRI